MPVILEPDQFECRLDPAGGHDWMKVKCAHRETFRIVGFIAAPNSVSALYLGRQEGGGLVYAGKAVTGFTVASARSLETLWQSGSNRSRSGSSSRRQRGSGPSFWQMSSTGA